MKPPVYSLRSSFNRTVKYKRKYIRNKTVKQKVHRKFLGITVGAIIIHWWYLKIEPPIYSLRNCFDKTEKYKRKYIGNLSGGVFYAAFQIVL